MKLYYSPGACSMASRISLHELEIDADFERVDLRSKQTETGRDYRDVNPLGYVPALELDDGRVIIENVAILPFIAAQRPGRLAPEAGAFERAMLDQLLGFLSSELHKAFGPFFGELSDGARGRALDKLGSRIEHVERLLADGRRFLLGDRFSVADAYAFVVLNWARKFEIELRSWPRVEALVERVGARDSVRRALREEGLLESALA